MNGIEKPQVQMYYRNNLNVDIYFRNLFQEILWTEDFISESQRRKEKVNKRLWERGRRGGTLL